MNRFTGLVVGAIVAPTLAISGGLERSELPTSFLYEDGNYLEVTYINRNFEITDKETFYCYSEIERKEAIEKIKGKSEITRFKGLGEISPDEFKYFIGDDIRLDPVMLDKSITIEELLLFYMGKNTPDRQKFIINNLKVELDYVEEQKEEVL